MVKDLRYLKINGPNSLYITIKIKDYIHKSNGNKYLTLISTDEK